MANEVQSALTKVAQDEAMQSASSFNSAPEGNDEEQTLKPYHPNGGNSTSSFGSDGGNGDNAPRKEDGRLDTSNMSAKQLADRYEAKDPNKQNSTDLSGSDDEDENGNDEENDGNKQNGSEKPSAGSGSSDGGGDGAGAGGDDDGDDDDDEDSKLAKAKMALNGAKQNIEDFKKKLADKKEEREKWKKVLDKAQKDDNWAKNKVPKWSTKLLVNAGDNLEAKKDLKDFEKNDRDIKKEAFKRKMALNAHGSVKKAEDTMENIKSIREKMAEEAPKLRRAKKKSLLEKHPIGKCMSKLQLDRFVDTENGLFSKIFDAENSACTKSCSMKMIVLTVFGSGILGTILTVILNV